MSEIARVVAFLDASVLYPALLRNLLMHLALRDLFQARWSDRVHEEWIAALLRNRSDLTFTQLARTRRLMDENVDEAVVSGYEHLIGELTLPDPKDRHVLAAAIHGGAGVIVTVNLRDFPAEVLATYGIEAQHPDRFISARLDEYPDEVLAALHEMRLDLKNPPFSMPELLASLARQGSTQTVAELRGLPMPDQGT
jgi:predicted nucleic acid-binding protein